MSDVIPDIPDELIKSEDAEAMIEWAEANVPGIVLDKRQGFSKLLGHTRNSIKQKRRVETKKTVEENRDPKKWPFKEGYSYFEVGTAPGSIYIKDRNTGLNFFCAFDKITDYLEEGFMPPPPKK